MKETKTTAKKMITPDQLRMIYGIARRNDLDDETVHDTAWILFGKESLKELTCYPASQMIDSMRRRTGESVEPIPGRASEKQRKYILALAGKLGMTEDPKRLRHFLRARFGVDDVAFLTAENAGKVIEGLKAMVKRVEKEQTRETEEMK